MFFDLVVREFEHLQAIGEGRLGCLCFCKVVPDFLVGEGLLDVLVIEVHNCVAIWESLPFHAIVENHLFFAAGIDTLNFSIVTNLLVNDFRVCRSLSVVLTRELETVVFLLFVFVLFLTDSVDFVLFLPMLLRLSFEIIFIVTQVLLRHWAFFGRDNRLLLVVLTTKGVAGIRLCGPGSNFGRRTA